MYTFTNLYRFVNDATMNKDLSETFTNNNITLCSLFFSLSLSPTYPLSTLSCAVLKTKQYLNKLYWKSYIIITYKNQITLEQETIRG